MVARTLVAEWPDDREGHVVGVCQVGSRANLQERGKERNERKFISECHKICMYINFCINM